MADTRTFDLNVLYVEDDAETRESIADTLRLRVKNLQMAKDGKEGLEMFKSFKPDLVITDIKMPNMNGLEMAHAIKAINKAMPIIITTAYNDTDLLIECIDIGVNQFVLKPIVLSRLLDSIAKCQELIR